MVAATNLYTFLESGRRNAWIREPGLSIYVRHGERWISRTAGRVECLDISSVSADKLGDGKFTAFLLRAEEEARLRGLAVFVENVLTPRFAAFFRSRGYSEINDTEPLCFIKKGLSP